MLFLLLSGRGGHRFGIYSIYRSDVVVSCKSILVNFILSHAAEFGPLHHVWHHAGDSYPTHRQLQSAWAPQDHVDGYTQIDVLILFMLILAVT